MKDYYTPLKYYLLNKWSENSPEYERLEKYKKDGDEVAIIKMYNMYKSSMKNDNPRMTKELFKEYIRNEIIEMLSEASLDEKIGDDLANNNVEADKLNKTVDDIANKLEEDNTQPPTTITIPEEMHYADFAKAVAEVLINEYGQHNFEPFMEILHKELGM